MRAAVEAARAADEAAAAAEAAAQEAGAAAERADGVLDAAQAATGQALAAASSVRHNVPVGRASGALARVDDAYPRAARELRVLGATGQNLWVNPSGGSNGVTVTVNGDGSLSLSGTGTKMTIIEARTLACVPGATYRVAASPAISASGGKASFFAYWETDDASQGVYFGGGISDNEQLSATLTIPAGARSVRCGVQVMAGAAVSGTYRVMLSEGTDAMPWLPPGLSSVEELAAQVAGKNLLNYDGATGDQNGYSVRLPNTVLPPGTYCYTKFGGIVGEVVDLYKLGDHSDVIRSGAGAFTTSETIHGISFISAEQNVVSVDTLPELVQLELGAQATAYEPPSATAVPVPLPDAHPFLASLPDGTRDELALRDDGVWALEARTWRASASAGDWVKRADSDGYLNGDGYDFVLPVRGVGGHPYSNVVCDAYATTDVSSSDQPANTARKSFSGDRMICVVPEGTTPAACEFVYQLAEPATYYFDGTSWGTAEPASGAAPVPGMPGGAASAWADSTPQAEVSLEYERDVSMVIDDIEAAIAALRVKEATNV